MSENTPSLDVVILSKEHAAYKAALEKYGQPAFNIIQATDDPSAIDQKQVRVMLADPGLAADIVNDCDRLQWIQSGWAGNTPLIKQQKRDYVLTGVKGVFGRQMREYVFAYLLYFSRNIHAFYEAQKNEGFNKWNKPDYQYLAGKTLGICGAGSIASSLLPVADTFGMRVIGLTRSGDAKPHYDKMYTPSQKIDFAQNSDFIVNLLPDTPDTLNFFDASLFRAMGKGSVLINAGRGSAIDEQALIEALNHEHLRAAVLDVFRQEPLPDHHPFWHHEKIIVTQHTAAESDPKDIAALFHDNARRFLDGEALEHVFDFDKGY